MVADSKQPESAPFPLLALTCQSLISTYSLRIQQLAAPPPGPDPHRALPLHSPKHPAASPRAHPTPGGTPQGSPRTQLARNLQRLNLPAADEAAPLSDACELPPTRRLPGPLLPPSSRPLFLLPKNPTSSFLYFPGVDILNRCAAPTEGTLDDVAGLREVKRSLRESVLFPLRFPHLFRGVRKPATAYLLYGPPGTGKTLLVQKMAAEAGFPLLSLSPSALLR
jgi:hypothetical protein